MVSSRSESPAVDLAFLLNQAAYALAARMGEALSELDLTVGEYCVLGKAGESERSQVEIAELASMDKSTVVNAIDSLEQAQLAHRRVHELDRRARVVSLTDEGAARLGRAHQAVAAVYAEALSDLAPSERGEFLATLTKVTSGVLATPSHVTALRRRRVRRPTL